METSMPRRGSRYAAILGITQQEMWTAAGHPVDLLVPRHVATHRKGEGGPSVGRTVPFAFEDNTTLDEREREKRRQLREAYRLGQDVKQRSAAPPAYSGNVLPTPLRRWRHAPPQQGVKRLSSLVAAPQIPPHTKAVSLVEQGNVLMLVTRKTSSVRVSFYNGIPNKVLALYMKIPPDGIPVHAEGDTETRTRPSTGADEMTLEVLPGSTKAFCSSRQDAIPKPSWSLQPLPQDFINKRIGNMMEITRKEHEQLASGLVLELEGEHPESTVLQSCQLRGIPYVDLWFPPQQSSTGMRIDCWARPGQFLNEPLGLLESTPSPTNLERGPLGNAVLLCILTILAETPSPHIPINFAKRLFSAHTAQHTKLGAVRVQLVHDGWWRDLVIDTCLPVTLVKQGYAAWMPAGARPISSVSDLWPSYLEKAYAKQLQSYKSVETQAPHLIMMDLTGYPSEPLRWGQGLSLYEDIAEWHSRGFVVALTTPSRAKRMGERGDMNDEQYEAQGLLLGHVYAVLQVIHINDIKLLHIRNPWGRGVEWKGEWGWHSPNWTSQMKQYCGTTNASTEGTFMMTWNEAHDWFLGGFVTYCMQNCGEVRMSLPMRPAPAFVLELNLNVSARVYLTVHKMEEDLSTAPTVLTLLTPLDTGKHERREDADVENERSFISVYELEADRRPYYICIDSAGAKPSELVLSLLYTAIENGPVTGSIVFRDAAPYLAAISSSGAGGVRLPTSTGVDNVDVWVQNRKGQSSPNPCKATCINHLTL
eukprot:TRINITY_DN7533_c0_g1_i3.p1 TRINITY_DN7533_c0_g1~~TRINITY_DN7533_c0_g1_i3.p1  ORF type:complete len:761 (+),score=87.03 TRINITY_DN7533_c0_g1_i3:97-2379(+)